MIKGVAEKRLRARLARDVKERKKDFLSWEKISTIALILSSEDHPSKDFIDRFVASTGKYVEVFYIETDSQVPSYSDWSCFTRKERTVLKLPRKTVISSLHKKHFDLVINACPEGTLFAKHLLSILNAPLKCSSSGRLTDADLVIKRKGLPGLPEYLQEVIRYLKMIRT
jgi:hypothetical protein